MPNEYAEAVEKWAREHGGHAKLKWLPHPMNCWAVILEYRMNDPRKMGADDGEPVLLHDWKSAEWWAKREKTKKGIKAPRKNGRIRPGYYAYDLDELGAEGIVQRLDKGNILSGRGAFASMEDAAAQQDKANETLSERRRTNARDDAQHRALDKRRSLFKIPFLGVGVEFNSKGEITQ